MIRLALESASAVLMFLVLGVFAMAASGAEVGACYSQEEFHDIVASTQMGKAFEWEWICDFPGGQCDYTDKDTSSGEWAEELIYSGLMSQANFDYFVTNLMNTKQIGRSEAEGLQRRVHEYIYLSLKEVGALTAGRALYATRDRRAAMYVAYDRPTFYMPRRFCIAAMLADLTLSALPATGVQRPPTDGVYQEACNRYAVKSCWPWKQTYDEVQPPEREALLFGRLTSDLSTRRHAGLAMPGSHLAFVLGHNKWGRTRIHGYIVHSSGVTENESMGFFPRKMQ